MILKGNLFSVTVLTLLTIISCSQESGPTVGVYDVRILAPVPGSSASVAYLTIANKGSATISITGIRSPQYDRVEMHETTIDEHGVSRMNRLERIEIPAGGSAAFSSGARHLMLMGARPDTTAGSPVTLEFEYNDGLLLVSATLQNRLPAE